MNNGPEFTGRQLDEWGFRNCVKSNFIRPGKPIENAFADSFNGRLSDECLKTNWFINLKHANKLSLIVRKIITKSNRTAR